MDCPECGGETRVVETATYEDRVRRRRECQSCGGRFTTNEGQPEPDSFLNEDEQAWLRDARAGIESALSAIDSAKPALDELNYVPAVGGRPFHDVEEAEERLGSALDQLSLSE